MLFSVRHTETVFFCYRNQFDRVGSVTFAIIIRVGPTRSVIIIVRFHDWQQYALSITPAFFVLCTLLPPVVTDRTIIAHFTRNHVCRTQSNVCFAKNTKQAAFLYETTIRLNLLPPPNPSHLEEIV